MTLVRTRFAPSPTGYLHIGSARTALYSWLFARKHQGTFILRIEDTDLTRSTQASIDAILESMKWMGLDWDEGPFFQTKRFDTYVQLAHRLLKEGAAYRCYCSKERLDQVRQIQIQHHEKPRYDGYCRHRKEGDPSQAHVIRFKNPDQGVVEVVDAVHGVVTVPNSELDDLVIIRTDGSPTYNFSVVVDDWEMAITHVIRGDDHLSNTPRQINMLKALGATLPQYAHVPMILGQDGQRLSKRHGAISVMQYKEDGFLPHALLNYLIRLGWSHGDQEIFSIQEMIQYFDLTHLNNSPAAFDIHKLTWLNQHYLKTTSAKALVEPFLYQLMKRGVVEVNTPSPEHVIEALCERAKTLDDMAERSLYFYQEQVNYNPEALTKHVTHHPHAGKALRALERLFAQVPKQEWKRERLHEVVSQVAKELELGMGKVAQPLRVAVTGDTFSPSIDITLTLIGRERVLARIKNTLDRYS